MPELPEVETVANGVHARIHGQTVLGVQTSNKPQTFKSPPDEIIETLTGSRIERVHRVGKTIVIDLSRKDSGRKKKPAQFLIHLGMTGRLLVPTPDTPHPPPTLTSLPEALIQVLPEAIQLGGSSVSDYVDADGVAGFFQLRHHVYSRTGQPCRICATPIKRIVIGGRSTHYCPKCQK